MPAWVEAGFAEYRKRMPREITVEVKELPLGNRGKNQSASAAIVEEGKKMLAAIDDKDWVIALDLRGKNWTTEQLSGELERWKMNGANISFLIGGPDGLAKDCLNRAQQKWSLSALTLPHPVVRVVLMEQLYRAETVLNNHPYHK